MIAKDYTLGIDIGSTTVKIAILDPDLQLLFADYRRHHADIRGTLYELLSERFPSSRKSSPSQPHSRRSRPRQTLRSSWAARTPRSSILKTGMSNSE